MLNDGQEQVGILSEDGKSVIPANKYADMPDLMAHSDFEELLAISRMGSCRRSHRKGQDPGTHYGTGQ